MNHFVLRSRPDPHFKTFVTFFNLCCSTVQIGDLLGTDDTVSCPLCRLRLAVLRANKIDTDGTQAEIIARIEAVMEGA